MKTKYVLIIALFAVLGCKKESFNDDPNSKVNTNLKGGIDNPVYGEIVIRYIENLSEEKKAAIRLEMGVSDYDTCKCADPDLELWLFDLNGIQNPDAFLEDRRATAKTREDIEGAEENRAIKVDENDIEIYGPIESVAIANGLVVDSNDGVTIAILDTGLDYNHFTSPFLYNSSNSACSSNGYEEIFGWNFVDDNNNPFDDHYGRHGTIITDIIHSNLTLSDIDHQILPVKVADQGGHIRYFDALCGFIYAANKPDVDIINMSFGWYDGYNELLEEAIEEVEGSILVVTSAGNDSFNNDIHKHYPSSFESNNILAMAAYNSQSSIEGNNSGDLAPYSNYGMSSVDLAANGNYLFQFQNGSYGVSGTSYSAAYTSFFSAKMYQPNGGAALLKQTVILESTYSYGLGLIKYSSFLP